MDFKTALFLRKFTFPKEQLQKQIQTQYTRYPVSPSIQHIVSVCYFVTASFLSGFYFIKFF